MPELIITVMYTIKYTISYENKAKGKHEKSFKFREAALKWLSDFVRRKTFAIFTTNFEYESAEIN